MTISKPSFTMGIEEEYLLVDRDSRDLATNPPPGLLRDCEARLGSRVTAEFMRSQIEVGTRVCGHIGEARGELQELRGTVDEVAGQYGLAPIRLPIGANRAIRTRSATPIWPMPCRPRHGGC